MRSINSDLRTELFSLEPQGSFVWLLELQPNPTQRILLCNNSEGVTFDGDDYIPFPFSLSVGTDDASGQVREMSIVISALSSEVMAALRGNRMLVDTSLIMRLVNTNALSNASAKDEYTAIIRTAEESEQQVSFSIAGFNFWSQIIPIARYRRNYCRHDYKGTACGYTNQSYSVTAATNASPIVVTVNGAHAIQDGQQVTIASVGGNTAANGTWVVTRTSSTAFSLNGSTGNGAYTSGGTATYSLPTCDKSLIGENGCAAHKNNLRFGAHNAMRRAQ